MKLRKLIQALVVAGGVLAISACSSTGSGSDSSAAQGGAAGGAQASGLGQDGSGFGDQGGAGRQLVQKKLYYFDYDKSIVREEDKPAIYANANYLISHPHARITLDGHTDPRGSREYNVALGERRANAIAQLLESRGVNASQIRVVSYGAQQLAVPGHSESAYQLDRRAVIAYIQG